MKEKKQCKCPCCENELEFGCFEPAFCEPCNIKFVKCCSCGELVNEKMENCPKCSKPVKKG